MGYPPFFDQARKITLRDPLAELLGAASQGLIEYSYADVVRLAGHSCPTVAGAYIMTIRALAVLYGDDVPRRGGIRVELRDDAASGVTGVIANVVAFITGAAADMGFKGLAGRHDRRNLLFFNAAIDGDIRYQRTDTGAAATVSYHPEVVPSQTGAGPLLQSVLNGSADGDAKRRFALCWQERVRQILDRADDPHLVTVR